MKLKLLLFLILLMSFEVNAYSTKGIKSEILHSDSDTTAVYRNKIKELLLLYEKQGVTAYHSYLYLTLGINLFETNRVDSALFYLHKALKPYQKNPKVPEDDIRKQVYVFMIHSYRAIGQHNSAVEYGHKLIDLASALKDSSTVANYCFTLAATYCDMIKITECLKYYKLGGELAAKIGDYNLAFTCYSAASAVCDFNGNQKEALALIEQAISYAEATGSLSDKGHAWSSLAAIYYNMKKYDKAEKYYRKGMQCYSEINDEQNYNLLHSALTDVLSKTGQQQAAWKNIDTLDYKKEFDFSNDSLAPPESYRDLNLKLLTSRVNAEDKKMKFGILHQQYLERETITLRQRLWLVSFSAALIIIVLLLLYNRQRQKAKAEVAVKRLEEKENEFLALQNETEQRLIRKYIDGLESERARISKELHDGVCNDLFGLELDLKRILDKRQELDKQMAFLSQTRNHIRSMSHALMPPQFQYATIDEMLFDYAMHLDLSPNMTIQYKQTENTNWENIPKEIAFEVYRIGQEALSNSIKHSCASNINVSLIYENNQLKIDIEDDGTGFDKMRKHKGIGIYTMTERVKSLGGKLFIETGNTGTAIKAIFDVPN